MAPTGKRLASGRHLVNDGAEGKQVGTRIRFLSFNLLGSHVLQRSENRAFGGQALRL
jgi:hypothetical protein